MEISNQLASLLNDYMVSDKHLKGWRFDLHQMTGIEMGLKNNQIGGPYSTPGYKRSITGEIYLIWENNRFTSAKLDSQVGSNFRQYMELWRATAYYDKYGADLFDPEGIPEVIVADEQIKRIIEGDFEAPFEILDNCLKRLINLGLTKVDGKVRTYLDHRVIMNSNGLDYRYLQTPADFYFEVNNSYGDSFQEKRWPGTKDIDHVVDKTGQIGLMLNREADFKVNGPITLIFPPDIFESFLGQFLIANLYGSLVVNGQSRFTIDDFRNQREVLKDELSLEVNNLLPYRSFTYPCTSEAVPGGKIDFITKGRLQTPILGLKYAKRAGMKPTPVPVGGRGFFLRSATPYISWNELIQNTERGLIVYSVLGLHTQDSSSGSFSLTADQCLAVEKGKIIGKVKAVINGDFLASLRNRDSVLAQVNGEDNPAFSFTASAAN